MNSNASEHVSSVPHSESVDLAALADYAPGSVVSRAIASNQAGSITLFAFDAGQELSEHSAPYDAVVQVLDGQPELIVGGRSIRPSAGQIVVMPAGVPHAVRAHQRFKMLLTMLRGATNADK